jgi:hypothetical protein
MPSIQTVVEEGIVMIPFRERVEKKLCERICSVCFAKQADGVCGLPADFHCPLFEHLNEVIEVVAGIEGDNLDPYIDRLRQLVCSNCRMDPAGHCSTQDHLDCALDMYFVLVVEIINEELKNER